MLWLLVLAFGALASTHAEDEATEALVRVLVFAFIYDKRGKVCDSKLFSHLSFNLTVHGYIHLSEICVLCTLLLSVLLGIAVTH